MAGVRPEEAGFDAYTRVDRCQKMAGMLGGNMPGLDKELSGKQLYYLR